LVTAGKDAIAGIKGPRSGEALCGSDARRIHVWIGLGEKAVIDAGTLNQIRPFDIARNGFAQRREVSRHGGLTQPGTHGNSVLIDTGQVDTVNLVAGPYRVGFAIVILKKRRVDARAVERDEVPIRPADAVGNSDKLVVAHPPVDVIFGVDPVTAAED
jgi:hypothetical protein